MSALHCFQIGPDTVAARDEAHAWEVLEEVRGSVEDYVFEEVERIPDEEMLVIWSDGEDRQVSRTAAEWANDPANADGLVCSTEY